MQDQICYQKADGSWFFKDEVLEAAEHGPFLTEKLALEAHLAHCERLLKEPLLKSCPNLWDLLQKRAG